VEQDTKRQVINLKSLDDALAKISENSHIDIFAMHGPPDNIGSVHYNNNLNKGY